MSQNQKKKYIKYSGFNLKPHVPGQGPDPDQSDIDDAFEMLFADEDLILEPDKFSRNFKELKKHQEYIYLEHLITGECKWVLIKEINKEGMVNAFYDANTYFWPKNVPKGTLL